MRDVLFDVFPIAHGMNVFDSNLLVSTGVDYGTVEKRKELLLRSVDIDHILSYIYHFFVEYLVH